MKSDFFLILALLTLPPIFMISLGMINIFKKDWSWWIAERMLRDVNPQRTPEWERGVMVNGIILVVAGFGLFVYVLLHIPRLLGLG